jgi:hypothetical protein
MDKYLLASFKQYELVKASNTLLLSPFTLEPSGQFDVKGYEPYAARKLRTHQLGRNSGLSSN